MPPTNPAVAGTIASGPITQIAWVTADIEATQNFLSTGFGAGAWTRMNDIRFAPEDCTLRGEPADFTIHVSLTYVGDLQLEVIQPVSGDSIYSEFLAANGPGLHHVCFDVHDIEIALGRAADMGLDVHQAGSMMGGEIKFAYLDGTAAGAPYIELAQIGPAMAELYESIKSTSSSPKTAG